jgi:hypothetical protein
MYFTEIADTVDAAWPQQSLLRDEQMAAQEDLPEYDPPSHSSLPEVIVAGGRVDWVALRDISSNGDTILRSS